MVTLSTTYCLDVVNTPGVAVDLSHINTPAKVTGYLGDDLEIALKDCFLVVIPAGVPRKPGIVLVVN